MCIRDRSNTDYTDFTDHFSVLLTFIQLTLTVYKLPLTGEYLYDSDIIVLFLNTTLYIYNGAFGTMHPNTDHVPNTDYTDFTDHFNVLLSFSQLTGLPLSYSVNSPVNGPCKDRYLARPVICLIVIFLNKT